MNLDLAILANISTVHSIIIICIIINCCKLQQRIDELEFVVEVLKESEKQ